MGLQKILLILFVLVCAGNSFGQTKEETIEWLNVNGKSLSYTSYEDDGGKVIFKIKKATNDSLSFYINHIGSTGYQNPWIISVCIKDILFEDISKIEKSNAFGCETFSIKLAMNCKTTQIPIEYGNEQWSKKIIREKDEIAFYYTNEENAIRVIKAIMHLAKLSGAKENKQTF